MLFATITTYFCLPETKGRSPAELDEMFAAKVPARQFKSGFTSMISCHLKLIRVLDYQCVNARENFLQDDTMDEKASVVRVDNDAKA